MVKKVGDEQFPETPSPVATVSGFSRTPSPSWNTVSKDESPAPVTSFLDTEKAFASRNLEVIGAETRSPSRVAQFDRTPNSRPFKMTETQKAEDNTSLLEGTPAAASLQALVSDSREFSCEKQTSKEIAKQTSKKIAKQTSKEIAKQTSKEIAKQTSKEIAWSHRSSRKKRNLPHFGPLHINRWVVLVLYCLYCVFAGPAYINWTPIADILFRAGAFAWICGDEQSSSSATSAAHTTTAPIPCRAGHNALAGASPDNTMPAESQTGSRVVVPSPPPVTGPLAERDSATAQRSVGSIVTPSSADSRSSGIAASERPVAPCSPSVGVTPAVASSGSSASMVRCADQEVEVNRLFTITAASHFFFSFIGGTLLDVVGPKVTSLVGLSFAVVGWVLLGAASKEIHSYLAGCLFLGAGVDTTYFPLLSGANLFPGHVSTVKALFGAAASFSFAVPLVLRGIYFSSSVHIKHSTLFFCYAAACLGAALLIAIFVVPWKPWKSPYRSLLSGERQRSSPLAAACGLATQSSQLPVAAADRAFDIIAVHYTSSSPSSPGAESLAALPEESLHGSSSSKGSCSSVKSSLAAQFLDHNNGNDNHILLQSPPPALAADYGECSCISRSSSYLSDMSASQSPASRCTRSRNSSPSDTSCPPFPLQHSSDTSVSRKPSHSLGALTHLPENRSSVVSNSQDVAATASAGRRCSSCSRSRKTSSFSLMLSKPFPSRKEASVENDTRFAAAERTAAAAFLTVASHHCSMTATSSVTYAAASAPQNCTSGRSRSAASDTAVSSPMQGLSEVSATVCEVPRTVAGVHRLLQNPFASAAASPAAGVVNEQMAQGRTNIRGEGSLLPQQQKRVQVDFTSFPSPPLPLSRDCPPAPQLKSTSFSNDNISSSRPLRPLSPDLSFSSSDASSFASFSSSAASSSLTKTPSLPCTASPAHPLLSTVPMQRSQPAVAFPAAFCSIENFADYTGSPSFHGTHQRGCCATEQIDGRRGYASLPQKDLLSNTHLLLKSTSVTCSREHPQEGKKGGVYCGVHAVELSANFSPRCSTVSAIHCAAPALHKGQAKRTTGDAAANALVSRTLDKEAQQPQQNIMQTGGTTHMHMAANADTSGISVAPAAPAVPEARTLRKAADARNTVAEYSVRVPADVSQESSTPMIHESIRSSRMSHPAGASTVVTLFEEGSGAATAEEGTASGGLAPAMSAKRDLLTAPSATGTTGLLPASATVITSKEADVVSSNNPGSMSASSSPSVDTHRTASASLGKMLMCFLFLRLHLHKRVSTLQHHRWRGFREKLLSSRRDFCSSLFLPIIPFFCVILTGVVFFIPSARHLLPSAYAANRIIQIFSFLPCPLFGHIADVCGIMPVMYICNFCGLLSFVFVMVPHIPAAVPLQYMASLLAASQLSFLVCQICCYVAETFEEENQGKLIGSLCCIAGLTSLSAHYIMDYAVHHGFYKPIVIFIAALAFNFLLLGFVHWRKRRTGRLHIPGRVFRTQEPAEETEALSAAQRQKPLPLFHAMSAAAEAPSPPLSAHGFQPGATAETADAPAGNLPATDSSITCTSAQSRSDTARAAIFATAGATGNIAAECVAAATGVADGSAAAGTTTPADDTGAAANDPALGRNERA